MNWAANDKTMKGPKNETTKWQNKKKIFISYFILVFQEREFHG